MEFLSQEVASGEPSDRDLRQYFESNREKFQVPPQVAFSHIFFSPSKRGATLQSDAVKALFSMEDGAEGEKENQGEQVIEENYRPQAQGQLEIDLDERIWTIPGLRMKSGREHRVPLSDSAIELLQKMQEVGRQHDATEYVFPSSAKRGKPMAETGMPLMLHRLGHSDISLHGFRSAFRDFASEMTNAPREVCEAALAHVVGDQVEAAYRRSDLLDRRRRLMDQWATYLTSPPGDVSKVIPMRRGGK
jgi:hypothetical protein